MHNIYIIIVTHNASKWIINCIDSVKDQISFNKVIIIDNKSTDDTLLLLRNYPELLVFPQNRNLGFGAANNLGCKMGIERGADFVLLLNQDTRLLPNCIKRLYSAISADTNIAVASPIHLNKKGDKLDKKFEDYINSRTCPDFISDLTLGSPLDFYSISFVNAAGWLLRVSVIRKIGLFSKEFFHYGEDSNFLQRVRYFNYQVIIVLGAQLHHDRDERAGEPTNIGIIRGVSINRKNIMLNINNSLLKSYFLLLRYSISLMLNFRFFDSISNIIKSVIFLPNYIKLRSQFKSLKNQNRYLFHV